MANHIYLINGDRMNKNRVVFIVLDGAPFDVFFPLAQKNILPNFKMLMNKGCFNLLHSTMPPISPVAMPSLFSGKNPGKHGMFGFGRIEKGVFKPYLSTSMPKNSLWDVVGNTNKKVILLNIPCTFPPFKVNGIMISGPPAPGNRARSYPPDLISNLKSRIGQYFPDLNLKSVNYVGYDEKSFLDEAYLVTKKHAEAMYYLMENFEWTLFLAVFTSLDRVQHVFFGYFDEESPFFNAEKKEYLIRYLRELDSIVGKVVSLLNEHDYLIVASDHGFTHLHKYVGINNILVQGGFAKRRANSQLFTLEKVASYFEKIGIKGLKERVPRKIFGSAQKVVPRDLDLAKSKAFGVPVGYVSINKNLLKDITEYEPIKKALINFFYSVRDELNGEKIVEKIFDTQEIYQGDCMSDAPDLVIAFKRGYEPRLWRKKTIEQVKPIKNRTVKTGNHAGLWAQRGILIFFGKDIKEGYSTEASIVDVAPTIMHILGVPIPKDVDGRVLQEVFRPESEFLQKPITYRTFLSEQKKDEHRISKKEEAEILEKLKRLGYI